MTWINYHEFCINYFAARIGRSIVFIYSGDDKFTGRFMGNDDKGSRKFRMEANVETPGDDVKDTKLLSDIGCQYMNEETGGVWYYVSA